MTRRKSTTHETLIERLVMVLGVLSTQLDAAINEITDENIGAVVSIRHLSRLIGYMSDAVVAAKSTNDTPSDRVRIARRYLGILNVQAESARLALNGRRAEAARIELGLTTAVIAQFRALIPECDAQEVAA